MFSSTVIRSALALAGLSLALSGQPSQAATVVSTAHYQAMIVLQCPSGAGCRGISPQSPPSTS
jgi:hypothetical protein